MFLIVILLQLGWSYDLPLTSKELTCQSSCLSWISPLNCEQCVYGYFLYTIKQDIVLRGVQYKQGSRTCVPCPTNQQVKPCEAFTSYQCTECLQNYDSWENTMTCSRNYLDINNDQSVYKPEISNTIFYLIVQYNGSPDSSLFITEICEGCKEVCFYQTVTCRLAAPKYNIFQELYISCGDQYYYDPTILGCNSCSNNCKVCSDSKQCQQCQPGYAAKLLAGVDREIICDICEPNCLSCAYVIKTPVDGNLQDQNIYLWKDIDASKIESNYQKICYQCLQQPGQYFLPQLDRLQCNQCQNKCSECEFVCYDETEPNKKYPTRQNQIYTFRSDVASCKMKCRACLSSSQTLTLAGDDCEICSSRCLICQQQFKTNNAKNSLVSDFKPETGVDEKEIVCLQCEDGYYLNFVSQGCLENTLTIKSLIPNCVSFIEQQANCLSSNCFICTKCASNYELQVDNKSCASVGSSSCPGQVDINCKTCNSNGCQECNLNYFPKYDKSLGYFVCSLCTEDYSCRQCSEYNKVCQSRPDYYKNECKISDNSNIVCSACKTSDPPFLGRCVQCGTNCEVCNNQVLSPYCQKCLTSSNRKTTNLLGTDCVQCPPNTDVCDQPNKSNVFYNQTSSNSITCNNEYENDQQINCCVKKNSNNKLVKNINIYDIPQFGSSLNKTQEQLTNKVTTLILESILSFTAKEYENLQNNTVSNVTFVLNCDTKYFATKKLTTITTEILKMVSIIKNFKLVLKNTYSSTELIQMSLESFIIFEYVNHLVIDGFNITRSDDAKDQQFGFKFLYNQGLKVEFKNCIFMLQESNSNNLLKFYFYFLNLYDFTLDHVQIMNLNYENSIDKTVKENIFQFEFEDSLKLPYVKLNIQNAKIYNCSFQSKAVFQMFEYKLASSFDNQIITINGLNITLTNFSESSGFIYQVTRNQAGSISMNNIWLSSNIFDNSTGLVYVDGVSDLQITNIQVINCSLQQTRLIYSNTLVMSNSIFEKNIIGINSQLFYSSYESLKLYYDNTLQIWKGLDMKITNIQILSNTVSYGNSLLSIRNPTNQYNIKFNVSITQLKVYNTTTLNFGSKYQATSGHIAISQAQNLLLDQVNLTNNYDVTIFYLNLSINIKIQNTNCTTTDMTQQSRHCLFLDNDFEKIILYNVRISNLFIQDGSAIAISSWKTDVLKTTNESINITKLYVNNIKIQLVSPQVPNSPLMIKSEQIQTILLDQLKFQNNSQVQENQNQSISASPGILVQSPFCDFTLKASTFQDHIGFGSPIIIQASSVALNSILMQNSNWFVDKIQVQYGGHLNIKSQVLSIQQSQFTNSKALYGGFLYYSGQGIGNFEILNSQIMNSSTQISGSYLYSGGLIYIAHNDGQLNMNINGIQISNITSEHSNIYIQNQQNQKQSYISIQNLDAKDIYAQSASLINTQFPQNSQFSQTLIMDEISIQQSEIGLRNFLKQFNKLQIVQSQTIQVSYGNVYLKNIVYSNFTSEGLFQLVGCQNLQLDQITIVYGFVVGQDLIQIKESNLSAKTNISFSQIRVRNLQNLNKTLIMNDLQYKLYLPVNQSTIIRIQNLDRFNMLDINNIKMQNLRLPDQLNALIDIEYDEQVPSFIKFNQLVCSDSQLGTYGCVSINPNSGSGLIQQLSNNSTSRRQLQNYSIDVHVYIIYTRIANIKSTYGSFLVATQVNIQLTQVACQGNTVTELGGCIYFKGLTYDKNQQAQLILDTNNSISGNVARQGGGIKLEYANVNFFDNKTNQITNNNSTIGGRNIDNGPFDMVLLQNSKMLASEPLTNDSLAKRINTVLNISPGISLGQYYQGQQTVLIQWDQNQKRYKMTNATLNVKVYNTSCQLNKQFIPYNQTTNSFDLSDLAIKCPISVLEQKEPRIDVELSSPDVIHITYSDVAPFIATEVKFNFSLVLQFQITRCPLGYWLNGDSCKLCSFGTFILSNEPNATCIPKNDQFIYFANASIVVFKPGYYPNHNFKDLQNNMNISFTQCRKIYPNETSKKRIMTYKPYPESNVTIPIYYDYDEKCLGGYECQIGYIGVLCQDCDRNKGYVRYKEGCFLKQQQEHFFIHPFEGFFILFVVIYVSQYFLNNHMVKHKSKFLVDNGGKLKVQQYYRENYSQLMFSGIIHTQLFCIAVEELSYKDFQYSNLIHNFGNLFFMPFVFYDNAEQINSQNNNFNQELNYKLMWGYVSMLLACLCGIISLYLLEWLYADCYKKQPYNIMYKFCSKKLFWRFVNAIQLVVYLAFPSLLQIILKFNHKLDLGGQFYRFLYPSVPFDDEPQWILNWVSPVIILILYLGLYFIKYLIKDDKINQLLFDSILSTQLQHSKRYLNEINHLILQVILVIIYLFNANSSTSGSYAVYNYNQLLLIFCLYLLYTIYWIYCMPLKTAWANKLELFIILSLTVLYALIFLFENLDLIMNLIAVVCLLTGALFIIITIIQFCIGRDKVLDEYIVKLNLMYHISRLQNDQNNNNPAYQQFSEQYKNMKRVIDGENGIAPVVENQIHVVPEGDQELVNVNPNNAQGQQ